MDFLKTGMRKNYRPLQRRLHVESLIVGYRLAVLDVSPEYPQVKRPAVTGDAVMLVCLWPAAVIEPHLRSASRGLELEADAGSEPVRIGSCHAELECDARLRPRNLGTPLIVGTEVEVVRCPYRRMTGGAKRPPFVEQVRITDGMKDAIWLRRNGKVLQDIRHITLTAKGHEQLDLIPRLMRLMDEIGV